MLWLALSYDRYLPRYVGNRFDGGKHLFLSWTSVENP